LNKLAAQQDVDRAAMLDWLSCNCNANLALASRCMGTIEKSRGEVTYGCARQNIGME
jgi:hypothetical protein